MHDAALWTKLNSAISLHSIPWAIQNYDNVVLNTSGSTATFVIANNLHSQANGPCGSTNNYPCDYTVDATCNHTFNLNNLSEGTYIIYLKNAQYASFKKLVITDN